MSIQHDDDGKKGRYYVSGTGGEMLAEIVYVWAGKDKLIIEHTDVSDALRGQGAGLKLVEAVVGMAREKSLKIIPLCPFANATFRKHAEFRDVLA